MKKVFLVLSMLLFSPSVMAKKVNSDCEYKRAPLSGKVKIVYNNADFKVKIVENSSDIKVKWVNYFPNKCGEWKRVGIFEDYSIEIVDSGEDFTIEEVDDVAGI